MFLGAARAGLRRPSFSQGRPPIDPLDVVHAHLDALDAESWEAAVAFLHPDLVAHIAAMARTDHESWHRGLDDAEVVRELICAQDMRVAHRAWTEALREMYPEFRTQIDARFHRTPIPRSFERRPVAVFESDGTAYALPAAEPRSINGDPDRHGVEYVLHGRVWILRRLDGEWRIASDVVTTRGLFTFGALEIEIGGELRRLYPTRSDWTCRLA